MLVAVTLIDMLLILTAPIVRFRKVLEHQSKIPFQYIDTDELLAGVVSHIEPASLIAIDTEADSFHHYFPKICLIQLTHDKVNYIIDPLAKMDIAPLLEQLAEKTLIIHDAGYDLRMLKSTFGFEPRGGVFDTMLAAQLLGFERFGLAAMLEHYFDVILSKKGQKSDWSRRPLQQSQLEYAAMDTLYLEEMVDRLSKHLEELGRAEWHIESCEWTVNSAMADKAEPDSDDLWRIKGHSKLSRREMAFVREIWFWRDGQSRRADIPPFKVLGNEMIIRLGIWAEAHPGADVCKGLKLPRNCTGGRLNALNAAVRRAEKLDESEYPERRRHGKCPQQVIKARPLLDELRKKSAVISEQLGIAPQVLASRSTLAGVAQRRPTNLEGILEAGPMMKWQGELLCDTILKTIEEWQGK